MDWYLDGALADRFVKATLQRYDVLLFDGRDFAPGESWSLPFNAPLFIAALQEMDDMNAPHNAPWWRFLHCGHERPN